MEDRRGHTLTNDDIAHYQNIVVALSESIRSMGEIDEVIEEHGGWPGACNTNGSPIANSTLGDRTQQLGATTRRREPALV